MKTLWGYSAGFSFLAPIYSKPLMASKFQTNGRRCRPSVNKYPTSRDGLDFASLPTTCQYLNISRSSEYGKDDLDPLTPQERQAWAKT
jgi:hypothetical protein